MRSPGLGDYLARHNPPPYYTPLADCPQRDRAFTSLADDLANHSLPAFSFITPNGCHDTHDCPVATGDQWLADEVPQIVTNPAYRAGHIVLLITGTRAKVVQPTTAQPMRATSAATWRPWS